MLHAMIRCAPPYDGLAITSFVFGVLWLGWMGPIVAVVLGYFALSIIGRTQASGRGVAIARLILGYV
jgi:hypothetical protein